MSSAKRIANRPIVTRRAFLRGTGVVLALPWLESLPIRGEESGKRVSPASAKPPVRFGCLYFSNGVEPIHCVDRY